MTNMSFQSRTRDWEMTSLATMGGANVVGGGLWFFLLRSVDAQVEEPLLFAGGGVGWGLLGGGPGAASADWGGASWGFEDGRIAFSPIECSKAFSVADLHGAGGLLGQVGGGFAVGASVLTVSAFTMSGWLFDEAAVGVTAGTGNYGLGAFGMAGQWRLMRLAGEEIRESARGYLQGRLPGR